MADLIIALDFPSARRALELVDALGASADRYKVGLELYTREGPAIVHALRKREKSVFLDLKLHDVPATVAAAVTAARALEVDFLTVHASGGPSMLSAASEAAQGEIRLLGVTVMTSLSAPEIGSVWGRASLSLRREVLRLASAAAGAGLDGRPRRSRRRLGAASWS